MEKIITIKMLYFEEKKTLTEISEILQTSISYISKILKKDERYKKEKELRKQENHNKRKEKQKELIYSKRKRVVDIEYLKLKEEHKKASMELSKSSTIGKDVLRKWCSSAYIYNSQKNRYEFNENELLKPADFPKVINV